MISEIVFFIASPLDKRDEDRFGLEILRRNGFGVEVWDLTKILNPERSKYYVPPDKCNFKKCLVYSDKEELIAAIRRLRDAFVLSTLIYDVNTYYIFRALSKCRIPYGLYSYNYPSFNIKKKSIFSRIRNITPQKLETFLFALIPSRYIGVHPARIILVLGGEFNSQKFAVGKTTQILWSHNYDYDVYLRLIRKSSSHNDRMGVFLDQAFPFHPDALAQPLFNANDYYPRLCRFFDDIEQNHGVHIVIAAHPRSHYGAGDNLFGKRLVVRGRTAELVNQASFVILHDSASINYAVLFKKPMIFITTDLLQKSRQGLTEFMASLFGRKVLNIDHSHDVMWGEMFTLNEKLYDEYKNTYIKKSGTQDTPAWQTFADFLKHNDVAAGM